MRWYHWVGIGVLGVLLVAVWFATGGRGLNPMDRLAIEVDAIDAKADVRRIQSKLNTEQALQHVDQSYRQDIELMDEKRKAKAKTLRKDPAKLAAFIVRGRTKI